MTRLYPAIGGGGGNFSSSDGVLLFSSSEATLSMSRICEVFGKEEKCVGDSSVVFMSLQVEFVERPLALWLSTPEELCSNQKCHPH